MELQDLDDTEKSACSDIISPAETTHSLRSKSADSVALGSSATNSRQRASALQRLISHFTNRRPAPRGYREPLKIRSLQDFSIGYPNLATFKNSTECFTLYRRFGYLQSRLLLEKQDVLRVLEEKLEQFDRANISTSYTRSLPPDQLVPRQALLEEIEHAFNSYATILDSSQQMLATNRPSESEYRSVRNYLETHKPLHNTEMDYIQHKQDLITLRPGRDHAWLDRSIDGSLHILDKPFPLLTRIFRSPEDALKSRSNNEIYFTRTRIDLLASSLITLMITALLIVPIYLLYSIVKDKDGKLDSHTTGICITILLVCTLLFSAVLSLFTRAKRHEILGAAAAYCAVLVVFLGNVPN